RFGLSCSRSALRSKSLCAKYGSRFPRAILISSYSNRCWFGSDKLQPAVKPRLSAGYLPNRQRGNSYACESGIGSCKAESLPSASNCLSVAVTIMLIPPDHRGESILCACSPRYYPVVRNASSVRVRLSEGALLLLIVSQKFAELFVKAPVSSFESVPFLEN